ncbi:hypothetical protein KQX54_002048 [Cotesia glomerata]|uniref:Uncharacterized protein n=1 Tax=Cotesia glomerata TaxID=32391 RepID=A0AAV7ILP9_COTGL|nr:hypothetical protein KQX54_002048 [Cotesia glomerata]
MFRLSSVVFFLSLGAFVCSQTTSTQKPNTVEPTAVEIAVILLGILVASSVSVLVVLIPSMLYYRRLNKKWDAANNRTIGSED